MSFFKMINTTLNDLSKSCNHKNEYDLNSFKFISRINLIVKNENEREYHIKEIYDRYCNCYPYEDDLIVFKSLKNLISRNILVGDDKTMKDSLNNPIVFSKYIFIKDLVFIKEYTLEKNGENYKYNIIKNHSLKTYLDF